MFRRILSTLLALALMLPALCGGAGAEAVKASPGMIFSSLEYYSVVDGGSVQDSCYYDDIWFAAGPEERNDALALISSQLSACTGLPESAVVLLKNLGFADARAMRFENTDPGDPDCAYLIGSKTIVVNGTERRLIAVAFNGMKYGMKGWLQDVTVNSDESGSDHYALSVAARIFLEDFSGLNPGPGDIVWLTGHSRAGAVANLTAAYLLKSGNHPTVFCRTFESPATTESPEASDPAFSCIHNYICSDDPICKVPCWGMIRYGQDILYDTVDMAETLAMTARINPAMAKSVRSYSAEALGGDVDAFTDELVATLTETVPDREAYNTPHTVTFTENGAPVTVEYSWQRGLQALVRIIFCGNMKILDGVPSLLTGGAAVEDLICSRLEEVYAQTHDTADQEALLEDSNRLLWRSALTVREMLAEDEDLRSLSTADIFALLRLLSPLLVDSESVTATDASPPDREHSLELLTSIYGTPALCMASNVSTLLFSHFPDSMIARLKLLAPAPAMDDIALEIPPPAPGDAPDTAPAQIREAIINAENERWLTISSAGWQTDDEQLKDNRYYDLRLTLRAIGHSVPKHWKITLNGSEPDKLSHFLEEGKEVLRCTWTFSFGKPKKLSLWYLESLLDGDDDP